MTLYVKVIFIGIFAESIFGQKLLTGELPLPENCNLPKSNIEFPHFLVGDAAFPLKQHLMRPYPGRLLCEPKQIFNYRLSRARRTIENAFGILVARWRILRTTINTHPDNAEKMVLACIALHNFIKKNNPLTADAYCPKGFVDWEDESGALHFGEWRNDSQNNLNNVRIGSNNATKKAFSLRDTLANYFLKEGAVPFQKNRIH